MATSKQSNFSFMRTLTAFLGCLVLLLFSTGCYTTLYVNLENATAEMIWVQSTNSSQFIEVRAGHFKRISHSSGAIVVKTTGDKEFQFESISPVHVEPPYRGGRDNIVGPDSVVLNLLLQTNMQIYVLLPGQKTVDEKVKQPNGYPKSGREIHPK